MKPSCQLLGTEAGIFRVLDDAVTPLSSERESITALAVLPDGELAAGTASGLVFVSDADRGRWQRAEFPRRVTGITELVVVPGSPVELFAGSCEGRVFCSADGGASFTECNSVVSDGAPIAFALPSLPRTIAAVSGDRMWLRSGGGDFEARPENLPEGGLGLALHPRDPELWMLAGQQRLFRSSDAGHSFTPVESAEPRPRSLAFERRKPYRLVVLCQPAGTVPLPGEPSPFWSSDQETQVLAPIESRWVDPVRDPSGEITSFALIGLSRELAMYYGTNRGELVRICPERQECELVVKDLPAVQVVIDASLEGVDPSRSGIFLLP